MANPTAGWVRWSAPTFEAPHGRISAHFATCMARRYPRMSSDGSPTGLLRSTKMRRALLRAALRLCPLCPGIGEGIVVRDETGAGHASRRFV
jgi:hypothetical protein